MNHEINRILLAHGGGGRLTSALVLNTILPKFNNKALAELADSARLNLASSSVCFTTDSFVVKPIFFPGGDIGKLAVCGTVNDLAVMGAEPVALSLSLIIEEGLEFQVLDKILTSAADTARKAGVSVVTGDTKVVEAGAADKIFITTSGIGTVPDGIDVSFSKIAPGDLIIINGTIGDHGMAVLSAREGIGFHSPIKSDCACLNHLILSILDGKGGAGVRFMRDPTRGGLAATINEIAVSSGFDIELREQNIPVAPAVHSAAEMLGFDLLNAANEGKVIIIASPDCADAIVDCCRQNPLGQKASVIGRVCDRSGKPSVELVTKIGGRRIVQMPYGLELPRIC